MSNKIGLVLAFVIAMNLQAWMPLTLKIGYPVNLLVLQDNDGNDYETPVEVFTGRGIADANNESKVRFLQINVYNRLARSHQVKRLSVPLQDTKEFPLMTGYVSQDFKLYLIYFSNNDFHLYRQNRKGDKLVLLFNSFKHPDRYYTVTLLTRTFCVIRDADTQNLVFDSEYEPEDKTGNDLPFYDACSIQ